MTSQILQFLAKFYQNFDDRWTTFGAILPFFEYWYLWD